MKIKYIITILAIFTSTILLNAQQTKDSSNFLIFGVPQYLLTNGLRIDFDIHKKNSQNWYVISPYYYSDCSSVDPMNLSGSDDEYDVYNYDKMVGGGIGLSKKIFVSEKSFNEGFYLLFGANFKYFDIDGNSYTWVEFVGDDGLTYQEMADLKYDLYIHSIGADAVLGFQFQVIPSLYLDFFMGFGIKYSQHYSPQNVTVKYNRGYYDYGYTGTQFIGGFRIGVGI
jgi:hypothetical protein